jgi:hypothetical protein
MAMSQSLSELLEAFRTGEGVNLIQDAVRVALQELIELEAISVIGAGRYERTCERKQPLLVEGAPFNKLSSSRELGRR